jgi:uncharacterized protein YqjF (DUF2071 family)
MTSTSAVENSTIDLVHPALKSLSHRPWPLPASPWVMAQAWHDLLFAHWPVATHALRPLVPTELALDSLGGQCWVGVIPFRMSHIHARGLPPLPGLSSFPELNVRTYVTFGGKPGVYFFSLDAASLPAVWAARTLYHLPYFHAQMSCKLSGDWLNYASRRYEGEANLRATYRAVGPAILRQPASLEHWLTERYCLYTVHAGRVFRAEIHHQPWLLQDAEANFEVNTMASASCIALPGVSPILHFAKQLEVLVWPLQRA